MRIACSLFPGSLVMVAVPRRCFREAIRTWCSAARPSPRLPRPTASASRRSLRRTASRRKAQLVAGRILLDSATDAGDRGAGADTTATQRVRGCADPVRPDSDSDTDSTATEVATTSTRPSTVQAQTAAQTARRRYRLWNGSPRVRSLRSPTPNGVPAALAEAIAWQESGWNNDEVSGVGAVGVMQIVPTTWTWIDQLPDAQRPAGAGLRGREHPCRRTAVARAARGDRRQLVAGRGRLLPGARVGQGARHVRRTTRQIRLGRPLGAAPERGQPIARYASLAACSMTTTLTSTCSTARPSRSSGTAHRATPTPTTSRTPA